MTNMWIDVREKTFCNPILTPVYRAKATKAEVGASRNTSLQSKILYHAEKNYLISVANSLVNKKSQ